jgi:hypothetical protein
VNSFPVVVLQVGSGGSGGLEGSLRGGLGAELDYTLSTFRIRLPGDCSPGPSDPATSCQRGVQLHPGSRGGVDQDLRGFIPKVSRSSPSRSSLNLPAALDHGGHRPDLPKCPCRSRSRAGCLSCASTPRPCRLPVPGRLFSRMGGPPAQHRRPGFSRRSASTA